MEEKHLFHVLAVDDNHIDRKLLERLLNLSSYQVTCVDSGDKALEYLGLVDIHEENEYDTSSPLSSPSSTTISCESLSSKSEVSKVNLIMTDYSMPGISGYDLLKRIKDSSWKDVPVVVMSSENVPSRINMCLEGGAEEFLLKPVKLADVRKIHSHLINSTNNPCDDESAISEIESAKREDSEIDKNCSNAFFFDRKKGIKLKNGPKVPAVPIHSSEEAAVRREKHQQQQRKKKSRKAPEKKETQERQQN